MTNELAKVADFRQFEEMVWKYVEHTNAVMIGFAVDGDKVYLRVNSLTRNNTLDMGVVADMEQMFHLESRKDISESEIWYELGSTPIKFRDNTWCFLWFATVDGFVLDGREASDIELKEIYQFLSDNPEFALCVKDGKAVIACK